MNRFDSAIRALESGSATLADGALGGGQKFPKPYTDLRPGAAGLSAKDLTDLQSWAFTAKGAIRDAQQAVREGKHWTEGLKKPGGLRQGLLGIAHGMLSRWSEQLIQERKEHIASLTRELAASDLVQTASYNAMRNVQSRWFLAEDALAAIRGLDKELIACMNKAECGVGSMSRVLIEDFVDRGPGGQTKESWGRALRYLQTALEHERPGLGRLPSLTDHCPEAPTDDSLTGLIGDPFDGVHVRIGSDSPNWCEYREANPTSTVLPPTRPRDGGDDPRDTPPPTDGKPTDGDDPRDVRPPDGPGGQPTDSDDGDDPRDAGPPSGGDPRDKGPCDELDELNTWATHLRRSSQDTGLPASEREAAARDLENVKRRIRELQNECDDGEDPRDAGQPTEDDDHDDDDGDDPRDVPKVTIFIKAKTSVLTSAQSAQQALAGQQIKLFTPSTADVALPGAGAAKPQTDHDQDPVQGLTDENGDLRLQVPVNGLSPALSLAAPALQALGFVPTFGVGVDATQQGSQNIELAGGATQAALAALPDGLREFVTDTMKIADSVFVTVTYPTALEARVNQLIATVPGVLSVEVNFCRDKQADLNDPYFERKGTWGQPYGDQWSLARIGLTAGPDSTWDHLGDNPSPVVVAVIDTGLDWNHLDFDWENLLRNEDELPDNGVDDDANGYVDDVIGWDFYGRHNKPWDHDGHGTFVSGLIAATQNNDVGIAGINPYARIMVLKALNSFGHSRASYLAKAIVYAADNGARIINMSVGGKNLTRIESEAIDYASKKGRSRRGGGRQRGHSSR